MNTHAVTTPNAKPAQPLTLGAFKEVLGNKYQQTIENYFKGDKEGSLKFMSAAVYCIQKTPALLQASQESLVQALMYCAELRLYPSSFSGEAFIIPYKGKAQFQLGYQGLLTLLHRAGIQSITSAIVHANDKFEYEEGLEPKLVHKPDVMSGKDRGEPIGVYAVATVNNQKVFKVMNKAEIMKFKALSQAAASEYSPWNSKQDPELWMWKKTCIKQLAKTLPKNEDLQRGISRDNEEDSTIPKLNLNAEGPATAKALHGPKKEVEPEEPKIIEDAQ